MRSPTIRAESRANREKREAKQEAKKSLVLTSRQLEIAVGTMLGDASLQTQSGGKTWRLKFQMSAQRDDYATNLCMEFGKDWIPSKPHVLVRPNSNMLGFGTISSANLNIIADLFMEKRQENGKLKFVKVYKTGTITNHLTDRGLSYWFMDDGGKADYTRNEGKGIVFNTHAFSEDSVLAMCTELENKFGFSTRMKMNKGKPIIVLSGTSFENFESRVSPYLVESMKSKMPTPRKGRNKAES